MLAGPACRHNPGMRFAHPIPGPDAGPDAGPAAAPTAAPPAAPLPTLSPDGFVSARRVGTVGVLTLNRPQALNALSLSMVRDLTQWLLHWQQVPDVTAVLLHGATRPGKAPAFCAGGDIRFFHRAALAGDPQLEDFFTEEYALNHLIHHSPKLIVAWMDGICMGGGMGLGQGAGLRVVTEHSQLAMPETQIGLFPDVGGGWFLARCPGHLGEYLGLTGQVLGARDALAAGWADVCLPASALDDLLAWLADPAPRSAEALRAWCAAAVVEPPPAASAAQGEPGGLQHQQAWIDQHFGAPDLPSLMASLAQARGPAQAWAESTLAQLQRRSPLMLAVTLAQIRRARSMSLSDELRLERGLVRHCFHLRPVQASETVEGIRALAVDKDHAPKWQPARVEALSDAEVAAFFVSPWPAHAHPLRHLD